MARGCVIVLICLNLVNVLCQTCPKQCDCDMESGLNRAVCTDQNIVSIDIGVYKEVQVYSLSHNGINELDNYCFKESGYNKIKILNLSYNLIFWIGIHAFAGLDELVHLDLSYNRLRYISSDLFWETPILEYLDLSGNVFESLKNEPFLMHSALKVLNLNNCRIKAMPDRLFTRLPNLRKLDLSENYMITLKLDVLKPLQKLQRLELGSEYWRCNPEFISIENWISSRGITYDRICKKTSPKMMEKIIAAVAVEKEDVDLRKVWNITSNITIPEVRATARKLTPFEVFDKEFSSLQALIMGVEIGLALGVMGTYIWLRNILKCGKSSSTPQSRRQRMRARRLLEREMTAGLLWSTVINPQLETPPTIRRQLSLPDRCPAYPVNVYGIPNTRNQQNSRSSTPPPAYNECTTRINLD